MSGAAAQNKRLRDSLATLAMVDKVITQRIIEAQQAEKALAERIAELGMARKQLEADVADHRDFLNRVANSSRQELIDHTVELVGELNSAARSFGPDLAAHLEQAERRAGMVLGEMNEKITTARREMAGLEGEFEQRLRQITHRASARIDALTEPLRRKLTDALALHEQQVERKIGEMERALTEQLGELEQQVGELDSTARSRAQELLASCRQMVMNEVSTLEEQTHTWIRPILTQIADHRTAAEGMIRTSMEALNHSVKSRLEEVRRSCEESVQITQKQMLPALRPVRTGAKLELSLPVRGKTQNAA